MNEVLTVVEVAALLNVLPAYVVKKIRGGKLPASANADAPDTVACSDAEAYRLEAKRRGRKALEELAREQRKAGLYAKDLPTGDCSFCFQLVRSGVFVYMRHLALRDCTS